jgi:hypothetical protein
MRLARSTIYVLAVASVGLFACGGGDDDDGGVVVEGEHHTYVVDSITVPDDNASSDALAFDLDGDGDIDNQLGDVLIALKQAAGAGSFDLQASVDESVAQGDILLLADIQATDLSAAANAGLRVFFGANPNPAACTDDTDTVCGHHLDGTGTFDVASDPGGVVGGDIIASRFTGGPGDLALQISFSGTLIEANLVAAKAEITGITATSFGDTKIGGGIPEDDLNNEVLPAVHMTLVDIVERDCTGTGAMCGCMADSTGLTLLSIFPDELADCMMTLDELKNNSLVSTLLRPDIDTDGDSMPDALSIGVGATGTAAVYTVPE